MMGFISCTNIIKNNDGTYSITFGNTTLKTPFTSWGYVSNLKKDIDSIIDEADKKQTVKIRLMDETDEDQNGIMVEVFDYSIDNTPLYSFPNVFEDYEDDDDC